jgi:hypothetical protein
MGFGSFFISLAIIFYLVKMHFILDESYIVMQLYPDDPLDPLDPDDPLDPLDPDDPDDPDDASMEGISFLCEKARPPAPPHDTQLADAPIVIPLFPQKLVFCMSIKIY